MKKCFYLVMVLAMLSSSVFAGRIWHYTTVAEGGFHGSALAMRNDYTWPTIVAFDSGITRSFVQTPVGWLDGYTSSGQSNSGYVRAASDDNGNAAFITHNSTIAISSEGWTVLGNSNREIYNHDVAFNSDGQISVLNEQSVSTFNGIGWSSSSWWNGQYDGLLGAALAYDSYGQANVVGYANGSLYYAMQGSLTGGNWIVDVESPIADNVDGAIDFTLTNNDVPVVAYVEDNQHLAVSFYDIKTADWSSSIISDMHSYDSFVIDSDSKGGVGLAYITNDYLHYQYFEGTGWSYADELAVAYSEGTIGLDFDYKDNPVISYSGVNPDNGSQGLIVAYDPIVTPEPVTVGLLSLGGLLVTRRRR